MIVKLVENFANYKSYTVRSATDDYRYWVVTAWHTDSRATDHIKGDLCILEYVNGWAGPVKQRGERPASSLERAWLATLIDVYDYNNVARGVTVLNNSN